MTESVFMRPLFMVMILASILTIVPPAFADTNCQPVYGGGQTCTTGVITIEKDVVNPQTNNDVHDLGVNDPQFHPGQNVVFHITVRNTGSANIGSATVKDTFPQYLNFLSGPGNFDGSAKVLTFPIGNLGPNQSQTFTVMGTVVPTSQLPANQSTCIINQASVSTNDNQFAQDSSQFCIQTASGLTPVPTFSQPQVITSPATGASGLLLSLLVPLGFAGYFLQKTTKPTKGRKRV